MKIVNLNVPPTLQQSRHKAMIQIALVKKSNVDTFKITQKMQGEKAQARGQFGFPAGDIEAQAAALAKANQRVDELIEPLDTGEGAELFVWRPNAKEARAVQAERQKTPNGKHVGVHAKKQAFRSAAYEALTHTLRLRAALKNIYDVDGIETLRAVVQNVNNELVKVEKIHSDQIKEQTKKHKAAAHILEMMEQAGITAGDLECPEVRKQLKFRKENGKTPRRYQCFYDGQFINYDTEKDGDKIPPPMQAYLNETNQQLADIRI